MWSFYFRFWVAFLQELEPLIEKHCECLLQKIDEDNVQLDNVIAPLGLEQVDQKNYV